MIALGPHALRARQRAERNPFLPLLSFSLDEMIAEVIRESFPNLPMRIVPCWFITTEVLAFITPQDPAIFIHPLLNRSDVPMRAFRHIVIHELLHLPIPPRQVGRKLAVHPPEFWERERQLSPTRDAFWIWLYGNYFAVLKPNKKQEGITVKRGWKDTHQRNLRDWDTLAALYGHIQTP